jgi:hypothetical protein
MTPQEPQPLSALGALVRRESQLNALAYFMIIALILVVGVLLFTLMADVSLPELWLLRNQLFRTVTTGLLLMVILYMIDQHARLRGELRRIHAELDTAREEAEAAYSRLAFTHRADERFDPDERRGDGLARGGRLLRRRCRRSRR